MKHEWRKSEKGMYFPKSNPELITIPAFKFLTIKGEGSPDTDSFAECIGALYSVAYAIKMTLKKLSEQPEGYVDYTVYPLEGVWSLNDEAIKNFNGTINKMDFVYTLMLRQPDFISDSYFQEMFEFTRNKKPNPKLNDLQFETIEEGPCVQMMHIGSYDNEPASFAEMEAFANEQGVQRKSKMHREIYLTDFRKVAPEKLKTVLRFGV